MKCKTREEGLTALCPELKRGVKVRILKDTGGQRRVLTAFRLLMAAREG